MHDPIKEGHVLPECFPDGLACRGLSTLNRMEALHALTVALIMLEQFGVALEAARSKRDAA